MSDPLPRDKLGSHLRPSESMGTGVSMQIMPLGGCGQFGMNALCLQFGDELCIVDCGGMLPGDEMPGVDLVLPDLRYLTRNRKRLLAYILTHGHEDHIGALPFALERAPAPVYGTPFTLGLIRQRLTEQGRAAAKLRPLLADGVLELGSHLKVEAIPVAHSIPHSVGLVFRTPAGTVLISGDFKMAGSGSGADGKTDRARFEKLGDEGVDLLLSDSTNALRTGYALAEDDVAEMLETIFATSPGRIFVALFATNVARIQTVVNLCRRFGRKIAFEGRSLDTVVSLASDQRLLQVPLGSMIPLEKVRGVSGRQMVVVLTGSQGEPRSALSRVATRDHPHLSLTPGDTVILSARRIPGRERSVMQMVDRLCRLGAVVFDGDQGPRVHASGHGCREDLAEMIHMVRPKAFLPVHGRYRMQREHADIARSCGIDQVVIPDNGMVLELGPKGLFVSDSIAFSEVLVEGKGIGDAELPVLRDRQALAQMGLVVALIMLDKETGELSRAPELVSRGFMKADNHDELMDTAVREIEEEVADLGPSTRKVSEEVADAARRRLRRYFRKALNRTPVVIPLIIEV